MNYLAHWTMLLYPSRWRRRYGEEVRALIDDAGADIQMVADLLKGAVSMQFSAWSFPRLAAVLGLAGVLIGLLVPLMKPTQYVARVELPVVGTDSGIAARQRLNNMLKLRQTLIPIIQSPDLGLYQDQLKTSPLYDVVDRMRGDIAIDLVERKPVKDGSTAAVAIQFTYSDPAKAAKAVQLLAATSTNVLNNRTEFPYMRAEILETPALPVKPLSPSPWRLIPGGLVAGLGLALLWRLLLNWRRHACRPRKYGRTMLSLAFAGAMAGGALVCILPSIAPLLPGVSIPLNYQSHATVYAAKGTETALANNLTLALSRTSLASVIVEPSLRLYAEALKKHSLEDVAEGMRRNISIVRTGAPGGATLLNISFTYPDPHRSQTALQWIATGLVSHIAREHGAELPPGRPANWGTVDTTSKLPVTIDAVQTPRRLPGLAGLAAGLLFAAIIAIVRQRLTEDDPEHEAAEPSPRSILDVRRFGKAAIWLTAAGAAAGLLVALRTPARYVSETLVTFENAYPSHAASLINDATDHGWRQIVIDRQLYGATPFPAADGTDFAAELARARRDLTWRQVETGGTKTDAFRIQFVSGDPARARAVLQDVLGYVDRAVVSLHGGDDTTFDEIRGVDGSWLPVAGAGAFPQDVVSRQLVRIPFDDERAKPVARPEFREMKMSVIDTPSLPSDSEGLGWWAVAIGSGVGLALAALITFVAGIGRRFAAKPAVVVAGGVAQ